MSRTFPQLHQQITSSSDFIKAKRDAVTYKTTALNKNSKEYQDYDNNFIVSKDISGCLISSRSYQDYLSISKGKHYVNPILSGASAGKYQSWMGSFLTFNQIDVSHSAPAVQELSYNDLSGTYLAPHGKNKLPFPPTTIEGDPSDRSLSIYPGFVEDPKLQFFYEKCKSTDNDLPRYITNFSELKPRERASDEYWRAVAGQNMTGFSFPDKPRLQLQLTDLSYAPYAPLASIDTSLDANTQSIKQKYRYCERTPEETFIPALLGERHIQVVAIENVPPPSGMPTSPAPSVPNGTIEWLPMGIVTQEFEIEVDYECAISRIEVLACLPTITNNDLLSKFKKNGSTQFDLKLYQNPPSTATITNGPQQINFINVSVTTSSLPTTPGFVTCNITPRSGLNAVAAAAAANKLKCVPNQKNNFCFSINTYNLAQMADDPALALTSGQKRVFPVTNIDPAPAGWLGYSNSSLMPWNSSTTPGSFTSGTLYTTRDLIFKVWVTKTQPVYS